MLKMRGLSRLGLNRLIPNSQLARVGAIAALVVVAVLVVWFVVKKVLDKDEEDKEGLTMCRSGIACPNAQLRKTRPCANRARNKCCNAQTKQCKLIPGKNNSGGGGGGGGGNNKGSNNNNNKSNNSGGGGGGGGGTCKISFYSPSIDENDGYTTTHDGTDLDDAVGDTVAVASSKYNKMKGKQVVINGKTYKVRDSCTTCAGKEVDYDMLVGSKEEANKLGYKYWSCSIKP